MGKTSEPQAGQWNTLSGSSRISGWPHSQAWTPRASGRPTTSRRVSSAEPSSGNPQESQRAKPGPLERSKPDSQNGQMMWSSLDAVGDRTLIAASFAARLQTYRPAGWRDIHRKVDRGVEILVPGPYQRPARRAQIPSISSKRTRVVVGCFGTPWRSLEQFELPGPCHRLRAAVRVELAVEVVDVGLDGAHADEQLGGDPAITLAGGYKLQNFELAPAQGFGKPLCRRPCTRIVPLQRRQEFPDVVRRDAGWPVWLSSLLSFEHPGQDFGHRLTLVDEGPDVALRCCQSEGLC